MEGSRHCSEGLALGVSISTIRARRDFCTTPGTISNRTAFGIPRQARHGAVLSPRSGHNSRSASSKAPTRPVHRWFYPLLPASPRRCHRFNRQFSTIFPDRTLKKPFFSPAQPRRLLHLPALRLPRHLYVGWSSVLPPKPLTFNDSRFTDQGAFASCQVRARTYRATVRKISGLIVSAVSVG